jgi:hypothetical protein
MKKLIIAVCVIAIIAVIAYFFVQYKPQPKPTFEEEGYLLDDSLNTVLQQELEKVSVDQTAFNAEVENEMVNSLSLFYYE